MGVSADVEVLEPKFKDRGEMQSLLREAKRSLGTFRKSGVQFSIQIWELYARGAHEVAGLSSFTAFAEAEFDLGASNTKALLRQGRMGKDLIVRGLLDPAAPDVGTTGLRALATLEKKVGPVEAARVLAAARDDKALRTNGTISNTDLAKAAKALGIEKPSPEPEAPPEEEHFDPYDHLDGDGHVYTPQPVDDVTQEAIDLLHDLRTLTGTERVLRYGELLELVDDLADVLTA